MKIIKQCYNVVSYSEVDRFLSSLLGFEYECVPLEEWSNDTDHSFHIDGNLSEWDEKDIKEVLESKKPKQYITHALLNWACRKEYIEPGDYLVEVWW